MHFQQKIRKKTNLPPRASWEGQRETSGAAHRRWWSWWIGSGRRKKFHTQWGELVGSGGSGFGQRHTEDTTATLRAAATVQVHVETARLISRHRKRLNRTTKGHELTRANRAAKQCNNHTRWNAEPNCRGENNMQEQGTMMVSQPTQKREPTSIKAEQAKHDRLEEPGRQ